MIPLSFDEQGRLDAEGMGAISAQPMCPTSSAPSTASAPCTSGPGSLQRSQEESGQSDVGGRSTERDPAPLTGSCCPPRLAAGRASRARKTPERGKAAPGWSGVEPASDSLCLHDEARSVPLGDALAEPAPVGHVSWGARLGLLGSEFPTFLCLWLAIWAAHWLLLPGVGRVCLSVPGRGGRPEFDQTCDAALLAGVMLMALYIGACSWARLCIWLGKWQCRASRVQNALEVRPPVVRLRSRGCRSKT